ncbi:MAG TPA: class I SAM-dependent methyltransferase, partial [Anaeromyxobacteraceae bacterium]|nr:class I SAM-dependent methyltransferase [Anaeromyxobacteraceae bacterium]
MSRFFARNGAGDLLARYSFIEPLLPGRRVLEVGAAGVTAGASALFLAERGAAAVVSIDDEAGIAEAARESSHPFVQFRTTAVEALPQRAFDLVLVADGAALAGDPDGVAALHRLLHPRGRLVTALQASEEGAGLSRLVEESPPGPAPAFEPFVGALAARFPSVEIATQSATVGYVVAMGQEAEPEISIDGSLAGTSETAWYVAVCGDAPSGLQGLTIVALPVEPLFEATAERNRLAASGGAAAEEALRTAAGAQAERDAVAEELVAVRGERDEVRASLDDALRVADELRAELSALAADREALAERQAEAGRGAAALSEQLGASAARVDDL